jgi:hypothetical protein
MTHRGSWLAAFGVVLGLAAGAASLHAGTNATELTYLTFSGPVGLPGVTLQAGTYAFELADLNGSANVVVVRNRARTQLYYMGMTQRVERPDRISVHSTVALGEAARGEARPITVWYPPDTASGHQFIYPR